MSANQSNNFVEDIRALSEEREQKEHNLIIAELELAKLNDEIQACVKQAKRRHNRFFRRIARGSTAHSTVRLLLAAHAAKIVAAVVIVAVAVSLW